MRACPRCGLELPGHARFCARCGTPQPLSRGDVSPWVLALFGVGIVVSALGAFVYGVVAVDPTAASSRSFDTATLRAAAVALGVALTVLCALQAAALAGLVLGREWGRVTATLACVLWSLTCVGLPISVLVLNSIWRRGKVGDRLPSLTLRS